MKKTKIGEQIWMAENLNVSKFRNGDPILEAKTADEWFYFRMLKKPAWCYFQNEQENESKIGKLYNWFAINDKRGLAPAGWAIPSVKQWKNLILILGQNPANKMISNKGWKSIGLLGTDLFFNPTGKIYGEFKDFSKNGFNAIPTGYRQATGKFVDDIEANWWCSTECDTSTAYSYCLEHSEDFLEDTIDRRINLSMNELDKGHGFSVRCIEVN